MPGKTGQRRRSLLPDEQTPELAIEFGEIVVKGSSDNDIAFAIRTGRLSKGKIADADERHELIDALEMALSAYRSELKLERRSARAQALRDALDGCATGEYAIFYVLDNSKRPRIEVLAEDAVVFFRTLSGGPGPFLLLDGQARFALVESGHRSQFVQGCEFLYTNHVELGKERLPAPNADAYDEHIMTRLSFDEQMKLLQKLATRLRASHAMPDLASTVIDPQSASPATEVRGLSPSQFTKWLRQQDNTGRGKAVLKSLVSHWLKSYEGKDLGSDIARDFAEAVLEATNHLNIRFECPDCRKAARFSYWSTKNLFQFVHQNNDKHSRSVVVPPLKIVAAPSDKRRR